MVWGNFHDCGSADRLNPTRKGRRVMKLFNTSKVKGQIILEALVDSRTCALLKTLENEKLVSAVRYKVLDGETVALYLSIENLVDSEVDKG